jgi:archaellum component FlaC
MTTDVIVPSNPQDLQRIKDAMAEISNSFTRIESERDFQKEALESLEEDVGIPKKYLRKMARIWHKQNMSQIKSEMETLDFLLEKVQQSNATVSID